MPPQLNQAALTCATAMQSERMNAPVALWKRPTGSPPSRSVVLALFLAVGADGRHPAASPKFVGHPKGLYMLFFAEMWERFSYYGMRALLIFYLTKHWLFDDGKSNLIYGAYTSLVYITPVLGGYLADRYLGQRKAVLFGGDPARRAATS